MIIKEIITEEVASQVQGAVDSPRKLELRVFDTIPLKVALAGVIAKFTTGERNKSFKSKKTDVIINILNQKVSIPKTGKNGNTYEIDYMISISEPFNERMRPQVQIRKLGFFSQLKQAYTTPSEVIERGMITDTREYIQIVDPIDQLTKAEERNHK